jgi:uridine kinase
MGFLIGCAGLFFECRQNIILTILQIGTAASAFMAIRVLLDHGVLQHHIVFVTFLVARGGGITMLRRAFPHVKVVCGAVDEELREVWLGDYDNDGQLATEGRKCWVVEPGIGQIGKVFRNYVPSCRYNTMVVHR